MKHVNVKDHKDVLPVNLQGLSVLIYTPVYLVVSLGNSLQAHVVTVIKIKVGIMP